MIIQEYLFKYMYFIIFTILFVPFWLVLNKYYIRQKKYRFEDREEFSIDKIYEKYFNSVIDKDLFKSIWFEVAKTLHFPAGKLRPDDRFDEELKSAHMYDFRMEDLEFLASQRLKEMGIHKVDLTNIKTLNDYILLFAKFSKAV